LKDAIDELTPAEAVLASLACSESLAWPESPSAAVIMRIGVAQARPVDGNWSRREADSSVNAAGGEGQRGAEECPRARARRWLKASP